MSAPKRPAPTFGVPKLQLSKPSAAAARSEYPLSSVVTPVNEVGRFSELH